MLRCVSLPASLLFSISIFACSEAPAVKAVTFSVPPAFGQKLYVASDAHGDYHTFWIKIEPSKKFSGKCEGYAESANLSGTWKKFGKWKQSDSEAIELTGSADIVGCFDGPAPEDGSPQCYSETRQFRGRIDLKYDGEDLYVAAYRSLPGNRAITPCREEILEKPEDYLW